MKKILYVLFAITISYSAMQCSNCPQCETDKASLQQQLTTCNNNMVTSSAKINDLEQQLRICNNENDTNKAKIIMLYDQLNDCNIVNEANQSKINELTYQLDSCTANLTKHCEECEAAKATLLQQINHINQQLDSCNNDKISLQYQIATVNEQLNNCIITQNNNQIKINDLTQQLSECNTNKASLQHQITTLTAQLQKCDSDKQNLNDSIVKLNDIINESGNIGNTDIWAYSYIAKIDSSVFNFWYSSDAAAPYQTRTSVGQLVYDQYHTVKGYEKLYNKSSYSLAANAAYLEIIIYDSTYTKVLYNSQKNIPQMSPKTEYKFEWNTDNFMLPHVGKYYISKVLYERKPFKDRPLEGNYFSFIVTDDLHSILKLKTYPATATLDNVDLRIYINKDSTYTHIKLNSVDSTYVIYINSGVDDIDSIRFDADTALILTYAYLSDINLLNNSVVKTKGITNNNGIYKISLPIPEKPKGILVAEWKFNGNGNDEVNKYPLTIATPAMLVSTSNAEGTGNISFQGSAYYANAGVVPFGNEFSLCFWFQTYNASSDVRPQFGNAVNYYPNGYICMIDEVKKGVKFCTGDGTTRNFIFSNDNVWTTGKWIHVVVTGSRITGTGKMYINGVDQTRTSSTGIFKTFPTVLPLLLGRSSDASPAWSYMDDFRIYNKILTPAEISKVYKLENVQ